LSAPEQHERNVGGLRSYFGIPAEYYNTAKKLSKSTTAESQASRAQFLAASIFCVGTNPGNRPLFAPLAKQLPRALQLVIPSFILARVKYELRLFPIERPSDEADMPWGAGAAQPDQHQDGGYRQRRAR
jgi:hypothetical protein